MRRNSATLTMSCVLALAAQALGQDGKTSITSSGASTIEKKPELMRLQVQLSAQGKSLKEALAQLKSRRDSATAKLAEWGADKGSIKFGSASATAGQNDRQRRMEEMVRARLGGQSSQPAGAKHETPVKVNCKLKAEWKIEEPGSDALLLRSFELREKIKAADFMGTSAGSAEEQEEAEESESPQMYSSNDQNPGEPIIIYVSHISPEEQKKALGEAYQKAKSEAEHLAGAANVHVGELQHLSTTMVPDIGDTSEFYSTYGQMAYQYLQQAQSGGDTAGDSEAVGMDPEHVSRRVRVSVAFGIVR